MSGNSSRLYVQIGVVAALVALGLVASTSRLQARRVTVLSEGECSLLLGGQTCTGSDTGTGCKCVSSSCGGLNGTNPCPTASTCSQAANGVCGTPNSDCPSGCASGTSHYQSNCGVWGYIGNPPPPPYDCTYICPSVSPKVWNVCGDTLYQCLQQGTDPNCSN